MVNRIMERIKLNFKRFIVHIQQACSCLFSIMTVILMFFDKEQLGIDNVKKGIVVLLVMFISVLLYSTIIVFFYRNVDVIKGKIRLSYGDILKIAFKKKTNKKIVVIGVNNTFDTIVDKDIGLVRKPLVSQSSLHGQWIQKLEKDGVSVADIDNAILKSLDVQDVKETKNVSSDIKNRGKTKVYSLGTIAVYEHRSTIFYLVAISEFDESNNAQVSKRDLINIIIGTIDYYDKHGNGYDIYFPLLGTGLSRAGVSCEESLKLTTSLLRLYVNKVHGCAHVVVYSGNRDKVSLGI